jgi:hypothetical protein
MLSSSLCAAVARIGKAAQSNATVMRPASSFRAGIDFVAAIDVSLVVRSIVFVEHSYERLVMRACLLLGLLFLHTVASADSPFLSPSLNVSPKAPSQSDALALDFLDQTGVHANVLETSISRSGQFIEVRASIELGHVNVLGSYEIHHSLQPLTSGIYQVAFVARTKRKRKRPRQVDSSKLEFLRRAIAPDSALAAGFPARRAA